MQLQGLLFMIFTLIIVPIILLSANHNMFFACVALILLVVSIRNIYMSLFDVNSYHKDSDDDLLEELEDSINLDFKKFGTGTKVVKNLIAILFFIYTMFYINHIWFKAIALIIILYWIYKVINSIDNKDNKVDIKAGRNILDTLANLFVNTVTIVLIILVAYNKFIRLIF